MKNRLLARVLGLAILCTGLSASGLNAQQVEPFESQTPPPPPDYAMPSSWAARPGSEGAAAIVPPGATPAARRSTADVFYVYPTTFRSKDKWNADVSDADTNHWTDISVIARQASIFNACCRIFAPRYRQASLAAYAAADGPKAYALAYQDVLHAFDYYIAHDNHGRPFILAGHSQGALMVKRLLAERIKGTPLAKQLVVAYVLGIGVMESDFNDTLAGYAPCDRPDQTGCVLSWNSFLRGSDTAAYVARSTATYRQAHDGAGGALFCRNPLALGGGAPVSLGALPGDPVEGPLQSLVAGKVSAACVDGVLMVEPAPELGLTPLPGGNMHYRDMSSYYSDIRADSLRRVAAFAVAVSRK